MKTPEPFTARTKTCWRGVSACVRHITWSDRVYKPDYPETA